MEIGLIVVDEVGRHEGDDKIEEPVARRRESDALRADGEREDFPGYGPAGGSPGRGEEEDVYAYEGDEDLVRGVAAAGCSADDGDDEFTD